jgi:hypothetical protein
MNSFFHKIFDTTELLEKKTGIHDLTYDETKVQLIRDGQILEYVSD